VYHSANNVLSLTVFLLCLYTL